MKSGTTFFLIINVGRNFNKKLEILKQRKFVTFFQQLNPGNGNRHPFRKSSLLLRTDATDHLQRTYWLRVLRVLSEILLKWNKPFIFYVKTILILFCIHLYLKCKQLNLYLHTFGLSCTCWTEFNYIFIYLLKFSKLEKP
jgi:hypothetical protein